MTMRTIKFRGKRIDNGNWVAGELLHVAGSCLIYFPNDSGTEPLAISEHNIIAVEIFRDEIAVVAPDTVGQFSGLLDKNGKEIYEGDIVRYYDDIEDELVDAPVIFHSASCSFCTHPPRFGDPVGLCVHWQFEVLGNIHDTPELIK